MPPLLRLQGRSKLSKSWKRHWVRVLLVIFNSFLQETKRVPEKKLAAICRSNAMHNDGWRHKWLLTQMTDDSMFDDLMVDRCNWYNGWLGSLRYTNFCWVGKHINIMKPSNSPTQGQPNQRKLGLKVVFGPLFPTASSVPWVRISFI